MAALVLAAHVALLLGWRLPPPRVAARAEPARVTLRMIAPAPMAIAAPTPPPGAAPSTTAPRRGATVSRNTPAPIARAPSTTRPPAPRATPPDAADTVTAAAVPAPPAASAAPADSDTPLLDATATRQAIRASARAPSLAGRIGPPPEAPDARLGAEIQRSARGDCLKGEYFGGGMGLLSLPFLAAAVARDDCRH